MLTQRQGLSGKAESLVNPASVLLPDTLLTRCCGYLKHDHRPLLGSGLGGHQRIGERGQRVAGTP